MNTRIILAGGTGFIGSAITPTLISRNYEVVVLTRGAAKPGSRLSHVHWDGKTIGECVRFIDGALAIVNLTGRSINCRHTPENRREIIESRVSSVRILGEVLAQCAQPPTIFVQVSAVGIYGDTGSQWCDEDCPIGSDFIANVCRLWEKEFAGVDSPVTRKILLRVGVVLGRNGGFLETLSKLTRCFLGGHVGNGRQFISWIHVADLAAMFLSAIERNEIAGVFNATAPNPVTNAELMGELRRALHRPWSPPVPKFAANIGSWLMGTEAKLAFVSQRCTPRHFIEQGFAFKFADIRSALADIYSQ